MRAQEIADQIDELVDKYAGLLDIQDLPRPQIKLQSNRGSKWLGRTSWHSSRPDETTIQLQKSILGDAATLERVLAHEMIHHRDFLLMDNAERALAGLGIRSPGHGASFKQGADVINSVMGHDFVTVKSDTEYVVAPSAKPFLLLISPSYGDQLGWAWATRLGPKSKDWVARKIADGARLVWATDDRWTGGPKIEKWGGFAVPREQDVKDALLELYQHGEQAEI